MPVQVPTIDKRSYADLVAQTERLANEYTSARTVRPEALAGYTLAEDVIDPANGAVIVAAGTVVDATLAAMLSTVGGLGPLRVQGWQPPGTPMRVAATAAALQGHTLNQDVVDPTNAALVAPKGLVVDATLAERISQIPGLVSVEVLARVDAGGVLTRIFAHMAELVIDRLNQAPEKNFIAFLDLIGTQILPPQPARVPLTFRLAAGGAADALVPTRTQAAAPPAGVNQEVMFETELSLVVTRSQLVATLVREPAADRYGDYTQLDPDQADLPFPAFVGDHMIEHSLYIAYDPFFGLPGPKSAALNIASPNAATLAAMPIIWSYWDGLVWRNLHVASSTAGNIWTITIADLPALAPLAINGRSAAWLRAMLDLPMPPNGAETQIGDGLLPDAVVCGTNLIDAQQPFYPFGQDAPLVACFIQVQKAFIRVGAQITLKIALAKSGNASANLVLQWQFWDGQAWQPLGNSVPSPLRSEDETFIDKTNALTRDGSISFNVPPSWRSTTVGGVTGRWLRVQISAGNYGTGAAAQSPQIQSLVTRYSWDLPAFVRTPPQITGITAGVEIQRADDQAVAAEQAFANVQQIDLSKDFYPFGEKPRFGDTLAFASQEVFAKAGATVTIDISLTNPMRAGDNATPSAITPVAASKDLMLAWEVYDGKNWQEVGRSTPTSKQEGASNPFSFTDETLALTMNGKVSFTLPSQSGLGTVQGVAGYWMRVRIVQGNYGIEAFYAKQRESPDSAKEVYVLQPATFAPPSIKTLRIGYVYAPSGPPTACQAYNDFRFVSRPTFSLRSRAFAPFEPTDDTRPTLYLGFDQPFNNRPITLYARVEPPLYTTAHAQDGVDLATVSPALVTWEYSGKSGWTRLGAQDETHTFSERGLIRFIGPGDFSSRTEFGLSCYWLRARWERGAFASEPRLRRILTNTVWANQVTTFQNEILGSSDASPSQILRTAHAPVLLGQQIEVREREMPSAQERAVLQVLDQSDAVTPVHDAANRPQEVWVRWQEVSDFYGSGPRDRHYVLDHLTGEVRFGTGPHGLVPPQGRNNIRAALYRTGGGTRGNCPARTITQLKTTVPYIDGVINYEAAGGGAEQEGLEDVKERGPRVLRHRNRAVTAQDFEDLAREASHEVALARALPTTRSDDAGRVGLILVPRSTDAQPIPSLELINRVQDYLLQRCAPTMDLWIVGPDWVRVTVIAEVAPVSLDAADAVEADLHATLQRFLHPLTGGLDRLGWPFGRKPHQSDLYALIESIAGVDHVRSLSVIEEPIGQVRPDRFLVFSGTHTLSLVATDEEV